MRKSIALLLLVFVYSGAHAAPLKTYLKREVLPIGKIKSQTLSFEKTKRIKSTSFSVKHLGILTVLQPEAVSWEITKPGKSSVTITNESFLIGGTGPKGIMQKQKFSLDDPKIKDGAQELLELKAWLSMDVSHLIKKYKVKRYKKGKYGFFRKEDKNGVFEKILVEVVPGERLERLSFFERNGDQTLFKFSPEHK